MPKGDWKEENEYPIPTDTLCPAVLDAVDVKEFQSRDRVTKQIEHNSDGSPKMYHKWEWTFRVVDGPYTGIKVRGLTAPYVSPHAGNQTRIWAETLLGAQWSPGQGIDTDALIGLPCVVTVTHEPPKAKRNGSGMFYGMNVDDIFPASAMADAGAPPF